MHCCETLNISNGKSLEQHPELNIHRKCTVYIEFTLASQLSASKSSQI